MVAWASQISLCVNLLWPVVGFIDFVVDFCWVVVVGGGFFLLIVVGSGVGCGDCQGWVWGWVAGWLAGVGLFYFAPNTQCIIFSEAFS